RTGTGHDVTDRGFTGHRHSDEVDLIYMNARYYAPGIGRFVSPDTLVPDPAQPQSFNRYSYGLNNPVNYTDPTGHYVADASTGAYNCSNIDACRWDAKTGGELSGTCGVDCGWVVGDDGWRQEYSLAAAAAETERGLRAAGYAWTGASVAAGFVGADVLFGGAELIYCLATANSICVAFAATSFAIPGISAATARYTIESGGRIVYRALSEMDARDTANGRVS
ncbi:MAG: RHS repeat-associated core domain-containing protein, partial [Chloroflexota bacterium]